MENEKNKKENQEENKNTRKETYKRKRTKKEYDSDEKERNKQIARRKLKIPAGQPVGTEYKRRMLVNQRLRGEVTGIKKLNREEKRDEKEKRENEQKCQASQKETVKVENAETKGKRETKTVRKGEKEEEANINIDKNQTVTNSKKVHWADEERKTTNGVEKHRKIEDRRGTRFDKEECCKTVERFFENLEIEEKMKKEARWAKRENRKYRIEINRNIADKGNENMESMILKVRKILKERKEKEKQEIEKNICNPEEYDTGKIKCNICNIYADNCEEMEKHFDEEKHKQKERKYKNNEDTQIWIRCKECFVVTMSEKMMMEHKTGEAHKRNKGSQTKKE